MSGCEPSRSVNPYLDASCPEVTDFCQGSTRRSSVVEPLVQVDGHGLSRLLRDRVADVGFDGQLVGAVTHGHERAAEGMTVDLAADFHEATGAEVLGRLRHHDEGPSALVRALLQLGCELLVQLAHRSTS